MPIMLRKDDDLMKLADELLGNKRRRRRRWGEKHKKYNRGEDHWRARRKKDVLHSDLPESS